MLEAFVLRGCERHTGTLEVSFVSDFGCISVFALFG